MKASYKKIFAGTILGTIFALVYLLLTIFINYYLSPLFGFNLKGNSLQLYFDLTSVLTTLIFGAIGGTLITAIFLKEIKNPVWIGISLSFLIYLLIGGGYTFFINYPQQQKDFINLLRIESLFNLVLLIILGALSGFLIKKKKLFKF